MSLFGDSPTDNGPALGSSPPRRGGGGLFDDEPASGRNSSNSLFDDGSGASSPWDMPTPRKQQSRTELIRNLLPASDVPESYIETFDAVVREDGREGHVTAAGIAKLFAVARLDADAQARIMALVAPGGGSDVLLSRNEFNVVLALVGLAQEGDIISLDGVDERRRSESDPDDVDFFYFLWEIIRRKATSIMINTFPCQTSFGRSASPPMPSYILSCESVAHAPGVIKDCLSAALWLELFYNDCASWRWLTIHDFY